jgi:hypothetical protein
MSERCSTGRSLSAPCGLMLESERGVLDEVDVLGESETEDVPTIDWNAAVEHVIDHPNHAAFELHHERQRRVRHGSRPLIRRHGPPLYRNIEVSVRIGL